MTKYFHDATKSYVNSGVAFVLNDVQYPPNWLDLTSDDEKAAIGLVLVQVIESAPADTTYYDRSEQLEGATLTVTWTPKTAAEVTAMKRADVAWQIDTLERREIMCRQVREKYLRDEEAAAAAQGITPDQLYQQDPAYRRVKDVDNQAAALRAQWLAA